MFRFQCIVPETSDCSKIVMCYSRVFVIVPSLHMLSLYRALPNVAGMPKPSFGHFCCNASCRLQQCRDGILGSVYRLPMAAQICFPCQDLVAQVKLNDERDIHVENDSSIGLRSGEYGGKNSIIIPEEYQRVSEEGRVVVQHHSHSTPLAADLCGESYSCRERGHFAHLDTVSSPESMAKLAILRPETCGYARHLPQ